MTATPAKVAAARPVEVTEDQLGMFGPTHCPGCSAVMDLCGHCRGCDWADHRECNRR